MCPEALRKIAYMELVLSPLCVGLLCPAFAFHLSLFLSCSTLPNFLTMTPDLAKHARPWKNPSPKPLQKSKRRSYAKQANLLSQQIFATNQKALSRPLALFLIDSLPSCEDNSMGVLSFARKGKTVNSICHCGMENL